MTDIGSDTRKVATSVVLGHPDSLISEGLSSILSQAGFDMLGKATTEVDLGHLVKQHRPLVTLFDPVICTSLVDFIGILRDSDPGSIIVLLAKVTSRDSYLPAIEAGASGCISVDISSQEFIRSLQTILEGNIVISKKIADGVRKELGAEAKVRPIVTLSDREREVLGLIGEGSTNREIARKLFLSEHTVKVHVRRILDKLDLQNRQQAAVFAAKEGLVKDAEDTTNN